MITASATPAGANCRRRLQTCLLVLACFTSPVPGTVAVPGSGGARHSGGAGSWACLGKISKWALLRSSTSQIDD